METNLTLSKIVIDDISPINNYVEYETNNLTELNKLDQLLSKYDVQTDLSKYFRALCVFSRELSIEQYLDDFLNKLTDEKSIVDKDIQINLSPNIETRLLIEFIKANGLVKNGELQLDEEKLQNFIKAFEMIYVCEFNYFLYLLSIACLVTIGSISCHAHVGNMLQTVNKQAISVVGGSSKKSRKTSSKKNDKPAKPTKKKNP